MKNVYALSCTYTNLIFMGLCRLLNGNWQNVLFLIEIVNVATFLFSQDSFGRLHDRGKEVPKATKHLTKLFPNKVTIHMPQVCFSGFLIISWLCLLNIFWRLINSLQDEVLLASWKHQLDRDSETLKMKGNLNHLRTVSNFALLKY